jgi:AbrB family looped-hinge helix DNA binding protein
MTRIKLLAGGRITIPKAMRIKNGWKAGSVVEFVIVGDSLHIVTADPSRSC